jgi:hypothetical protein
MDKLFKDVKDLLDKYPMIKFVACFAGIYFIYRAGKAVGEFIYYVTQ